MGRPWWCAVALLAAHVMESAPGSVAGTEAVPAPVVLLTTLFANEREYRATAGLPPLTDPRDAASPGRRPRRLPDPSGRNG
jgi:hypothetical protein